MTFKHNYNVLTSNNPNTLLLYNDPSYYDVEHIDFIIDVVSLTRNTELYKLINHRLAHGSTTSELMHKNMQHNVNLSIPYANRFYEMLPTREEDTFNTRLTRQLLMDILYQYCYKDNIKKYYKVLLNNPDLSPDMIREFTDNDLKYRQTKFVFKSDDLEEFRKLDIRDLELIQWITSYDAVNITEYLINCDKIKDLVRYQINLPCSVQIFELLCEYATNNGVNIVMTLPESYMYLNLKFLKDILDGRVIMPDCISFKPELNTRSGSFIEFMKNDVESVDENGNLILKQ